MSFLKSLVPFFGKESGAPKGAPSNLPERNEPCWCGSGKKYKKCHLEGDEKKRPVGINCGSA